MSYIDLESVEQIIYLRSALEKEIMKELSSQIALSDVQKLSDILDRQRAVIEEDHATDQFLSLMISSTKPCSNWWGGVSLASHSAVECSLYQISQAAYAGNREADRHLA